MDLATGLLETARAGGKLSTIIYTIATSHARIDTDFTDIAGDVALAANALTDVGHFLGDRTACSIASAYAFEDARSILTRCKNSFAEVKEISDTEHEKSLRKHGLTRLQGSFQARRLELLKKRLESLKSSLILLLSVLKFKGEEFRRSRADSEVQQQSQAIQQLYHRHRSALADVQTLERRLEAASSDTIASSELQFEIQAIHESSNVPSLPSYVSTAFALESEHHNGTPKRQMQTTHEILNLISSTKSFLASVEGIVTNLNDSELAANCLTTVSSLVSRQSQHFSDYLASQCRASVKSDATVTRPRPPVTPYYELGFEGEQDGFDLDFAADGPDVLENFDFDSFLHNTDDNKSFDDFDFIDFAGEADIVPQEKSNESPAAATHLSEDNLHYKLETRSGDVPVQNAQGNHALQDYQMQLVLLENQNKRRLLMARQEQDNMDHIGQSDVSSQRGQSSSTQRAGHSEDAADNSKGGSNDWLFGGPAIETAADEVVAMLLGRWTTIVQADS